MLESNSPSYLGGQTLEAATAEIALAEMEFLVLVTEDGRFFRMAGPFRGPVAAAAANEPPQESSVLKAIAQLLGAVPEEPGGLGGVRAAGLEEQQPADTRSEPWLIHAQRNGDQCVLRGDAVVLWREDSGDAATAEVMDVAGRRSAALHWGGNQATADWPFESPPADGGIYLVRRSEELRSVAIRFHTLAPALSDAGLAAAGWLAAKGCTEQARIMLRG